MKTVSRILFSFIVIMNCYQSSAGHEFDLIKDSSPLLTRGTPRQDLLSTSMTSALVEHNGHHLPKNRQECILAESAFWRGEELYHAKQYNDSITYFLEAEKYWEPECLRYLYNFLESSKFYVNEMNVLQENIDKIKLQIPTQIDLKTAEQMYQQRFLKITYLSGITQDQVHDNNKKKVSSTPRLGISYLDAPCHQRSVFTDFKKIMKGACPPIFSWFSINTKED